MQRNAGAFIASLPALARRLDCAPLSRSLMRAMLAARLNAFLPASVWKKDKGEDTAAFYDPAQPRDKYGRWANSGSFANSVKFSSKELKGTPANPSKLYENYLKNGGRPLAHDKLPAVAEVTRASIQHRNTTDYLQLRNAIINQPKLLQTLFRRGHLSTEAVKYSKRSKIDKNKTDWETCWHVRGDLRINSAEFAYDFTVFQRKSNHKTVLYDFVIKAK